MDYFLFNFSGVQFHYTMSLFIKYIIWGDRMNDNENIKQEVLPAGIVTMLFAENKRIIDKQFYIMAGMLFANIGLIALLAYVLKR